MLDFYRGTLSARRLGVLVRGLSRSSLTAEAQNGGKPVWSNFDHLLADVWVVLVRILNRNSRISDHPRRAAMESARRAAAKSSRIAELRAVFNKRKKKYGLR